MICHDFEFHSNQQRKQTDSIHGTLGEVRINKMYQQNQLHVQGANGVARAGYGAAFEGGTQPTNEKPREEAERCFRTNIMGTKWDLGVFCCISPVFGETKKHDATKNVGGIS